MKCGEMIEYLSRFEAESEVSVVVVDIEKHIYHKICGYQMIDEMPVLLFETDESGALDEIAEEVSEPDEKAREHCGKEKTEGKLCPHTTEPAESGWRYTERNRRI